MIKSLRITAPFYLIAAFVAAGIFLVPFYRYAIDPDGICYISIAQKYMRGEIFDAVNACWGPLYSIPLLIISFLLCAGPARRTPQGFVLVSALTTLALWTLGFLLIVTEERYLWLDNFFLLCLSAQRSEVEA
jgi:hypothetical protein